MTVWAYFTNGPNAAASIAPTLIRHWVSGVAGLSASSSSKADTLNIFDVKPAGCDSYFITETINALFPVVNFLKCVVAEVVLFSGTFMAKTSCVKVR